MMSCHKGTALPAGSTGKEAPRRARPSSSPVEITTMMSPAYTKRAVPRWMRPLRRSDAPLSTCVPAHRARIKTGNVDAQCGHMVLVAGRHVGMDHLARIDDAIEFGLRDKP